MPYPPQTQAAYGQRITVQLVCLGQVALSLKAHPQVNSQWFDDKMVLNHHVHVGVAVAVEDGLVVPVLKFANEMNLPQIGSQVRDFAARSKSKESSCSVTIAILSYRHHARL